MTLKLHSHLQRDELDTPKFTVFSKGFYCGEWYNMSVWCLSTNQSMAIVILGMLIDLLANGGLVVAFYGMLLTCREFGILMEVWHFNESSSYL